MNKRIKLWVALIDMEWGRTGSIKEAVCRIVEDNKQSMCVKIIVHW